jgi:HSP20 family protein
MALPTAPNGSWTSDFELPSLFGRDWNDDGFELYQEDDEFILTVDMPGFSSDEIDLRWDDGRLYVTATHHDEERGQQEQYYRSFRLPKRIANGAIEASHANGVLEVTLPVAEGAAPGREIPTER